MASDNNPDLLGLCETFLQKNNSDSQISINGFNVLRKDRSDTQEKTLRKFIITLNTIT